VSLPTIAQALVSARDAGVDRLDAQLLLAACTGRSRASLIANDDVALSPSQAATWADWLRRRAGGQPVAYILGEKEFHGLVLNVDSSVLVPRPDTETLVDWALELLAQSAPSMQVVDLGTGSGAIALAIKHARHDARVTGLDASIDALTVAQANGARLELDVAWRAGHWWQAVGDQRFDLAVSNPPYIAENDPHLAALSHEPRSALTSGPDGLDDIRLIIAGAHAHLQPGAWLLFEHGHDQAAAVSELFQAAGFVDVQSRRDLAGLARCTGARAPH